MARKLSVEQTLHLVSLYRSQECLWNVFLDAHKNTILRKRALQQICDELDIEGFSVADVKYKIKTLRSTYYLELDKIRKSQGSDNIYKPKALWFDEMDSFLKNVLIKRKVQDTDDEHIETNTSTHESDQPDKEENDGDSISDPPSHLPENHRPKKRKISRRDDKIKVVSGLRDCIRDVSELRDRKDVPRDIIRGEDEYDVFGKHVACQLRQLSTFQYVLAQEEIQSTISKCRINDLE